ncbi:hypothetical protein LX32DRAFT_352733 [Colletotrichum zoysiae]|uniref:Uncharacterized protein n=1 Tax=Colletotrichum zoysiae TaxID=1216348 RepID=A0AAD9M5U1_9PEZI|nr:hypothetical protein LX32DRAFT_352733 [Colletotrichum zoysiae]
MTWIWPSLSSPLTTPGLVHRWRGATSDGLGRFGYFVLCLFSSKPDGLECQDTLIAPPRSRARPPMRIIRQTVYVHRMYACVLCLGPRNDT